MFGLLLGSMTAAHADVVQCGDVLGPGGRFELEDDLDCPRTVVPGITVRDHATLDLKRHIVTCDNFGGCIVLTGTGAQLLNGAVQGGLHESIVLGGHGRHVVKDVTSMVVDANVLVLMSDNNQLINVMAESVFSPAFIIRGNHNRLTNSIAQCFGRPGGCIFVVGDNNRLINNFVTSTASLLGGIVVSGNNNVLARNRAIRNEGPGISVGGIGNIVMHNTALENSPDLQGDCTHNIWQENTFRTSDPACIDERLGRFVGRSDDLENPDEPEMR
jgi:hypothetical protein